MLGEEVSWGCDRKVQAPNAEPPVDGSTTAACPRYLPVRPPVSTTYLPVGTFLSRHDGQRKVPQLLAGYFYSFIEVFQCARLSLGLLDTKQ
jgi:hypothetical protein